VLSTIELNHQALLKTAKVDDEVTDRVLAAEFCAGDFSCAQVRPEIRFHVGLVAVQSASSVA
jgi:hypothetical protein